MAVLRRSRRASRRCRLLVAGIVATACATGLIAVAAGESPATVQVTVVLTGTGSGSVASTSPDGRLSCGSTCTASFTVGTAVTLTATAVERPTGDSHFASWSGDCAGTATICTLVVQHPASVTATFTPGPGPASPPPSVAPSHFLNVSRGSGGSVHSDPVGIDCGTTCSETFAEGSSPTLTAVPAHGWAFESWTPPCGRVATCAFAIGNRDASVGASFRHLYPVGVHVSGSGAVSADAAPLSTCTGSCSANYRSDVTLVLHAVPAAGSHFVRWTGDCDGTAPACSLATDAPADATATFAAGAQAPSPIRVTTTRGGSVVQAGSNLAAVAQAGFAFQGWTGACTGTGTCTATAGDVRATFRHLFRLTVLRQNPTTFASRNVVSSPAGINCGTTCSAVFRSDADVTLTTSAVPLGALFASWDGGCSGGTPIKIAIEGVCLVAVDADTEVTANFRAPVLGVVTYAINVTVVGPGKVDSSPAGIDCGLRCSATATERVILTAHAQPLRSRFVTWTGACTGTGPCVVRPPSQPVAATFVACTLRLASLTVTRPRPRQVHVAFTASEPAAVTINVGRRNRAPFTRSTVNARLTPLAFTFAVPASAATRRLSVRLSGRDRCGAAHALGTRSV